MVLLVVLKYLYSQVYTKEIPDELTLGISILGCPIHCPECHSPHMWDTGDATGIELTENELDRLVSSQRYISCILFFGGEWNMPDMVKLLAHLTQDKRFKLALYSGHNLKDFESGGKCEGLLSYLDYLKVGNYDPILGSLDYPSTNQRLYKLKGGKIVKDITYKFWKGVNIR